MKISVLTVPVRGSQPSFDPASDPRTPTLAPSAWSALPEPGPNPRRARSSCAELMPDPFLIELVPDRVDLLQASLIFFSTGSRCSSGPHLGPFTRIWSRRDGTSWRTRRGSSALCHLSIGEVLPGSYSTAPPSLSRSNLGRLGPWPFPDHRDRTHGGSAAIMRTASSAAPSVSFIFPPCRCLPYKSNRRANRPESCPTMDIIILFLCHGSAQSTRLCPGRGECILLYSDPIHE
jgi:hypothetical protein